MVHEGLFRYLDNVCRSGVREVKDGELNFSG